MTIGQNIRALRKARGLTQARLGALCHISGASIGSYEKGATLPRRRVLEQLSAALDVPVERLTAGAAQPVHDAQASSGPLYDGVLAALGELYGTVEGRIVRGENGGSRRYYMVQGAAGSFVLYDQDIAAIARSAKASISPLVERLSLRR